MKFIVRECMHCMRTVSNQQAVDCILAGHQVQLREYEEKIKHEIRTPDDRIIFK